MFVRWSGQRQIVPAWVFRPGLQVVGKPFGQVDRLELGEPALVISTSEEEQPLDDPLQVLTLPLQGIQDPVIILDGPVFPERDLDLTKHRGEWRSKLVRGVAGESPLALERFLKAIEQSVEGAAQLFQFVTRLNTRQPVIEIGRGHRSGVVGHQGHRRECLAADPTAGQGGHQAHAQRQESREHSQACEASLPQVQAFAPP